LLQNVTQGQRKVGPYEQGNEPLGSIKDEFLD